jgi:cystathionine beta-lyase/cystathionine gamma-synthase
MNFDTKLIHLGQDADKETGAVNTPIYLSSTFKQDGIGSLRSGYEYSRSGNPTRSALEKTIAGLEGAEYGLSFASGLAAETAIFNLLKPGDEVVSTIDVYGGTYRLAKKVYEKYGINFKFLNTNDAKVIASNITEKTWIIWIETPTNPLLNIIDIKEIAKHKNEKIIFVVDNTFASPYFQSPLALGADIVVHSVTKYISGHSTVIGGALVTKREDLYDELKFYQNATGAVPSPFDCFLIQTGLKTLSLRMKKHEENAAKTAEFLSGHEKVEKTFYPGLKDHPNHETAKSQMRGFGGMVSFRVKGGRKGVDDFFGKIKIFTLAESLGGVESLACYPYTMSHGSMPESEKKAIGITEDLIRLSAGIEDATDLIEDISQAL